MQAAICSRKWWGKDEAFFLFLFLHFLYFRGKHCDEAEHLIFSATQRHSSSVCDLVFASGWNSASPPTGLGFFHLPANCLPLCPQHKDSSTMTTLLFIIRGCWAATKKHFNTQQLQLINPGYYSVTDSINWKFQDQMMLSDISFKILRGQTDGTAQRCTWWVQQWSYYYRHRKRDKVSSSQ